MSFKNNDLAIDGWKNEELNSICDVIDSLHKTPQYSTTGYPMIRVKDLYEGYFKVSNPAYVSEEVYEEFSKKYKPEFGDILFSRVGSYGIASFVNTSEAFCLGQNTVGITNFREDVYNKFVYYSLISPNVKKQIEALVTGSTQKTISMKSIKSFKIDIPSLMEQKSIAHILSTLDEKIEVNNQINKILENMAQAIFKQWFVDFEFPNEDGMPYESSGGKMVESELGLIPLGWKVHLLKDFVPVITGKKNANVATNSGKYKFFTCSQIASKTDDYSFEGKAILVAGNGDFNVKFYNGKFEAYQRTYVLIPHKEDLSGFIYYMMDYNLEEIVTNARGSVISYLTKGDLEDSKIAFPEKENHIQYTVIFQIINEFILNLNKENEKLSELRDTLLPKLMSGEIRVPLDSEGDVS